MKKYFVFGMLEILFIFFLLNFIPNSQKSESMGIITLNFDDGLKSQYENAFTEMQRYDYPGTLFLMANQTGIFEGRELMSFERAKEMQDAGWEIGSHGMKHEAVNKDNLYSQLVLSKQVLSSNGFFVDLFACPYGCNESLVDLRRLGNENYITVRSIDWGENDRDDYNPQRLSSKWVNNVNSAEEVCDWIKASEENDKWLILIFHGIDEDDKPVHPYDFSLENFKKVLECVDKSHMEVKTIGEVIKNE